ncbi:MAG: S8 family serine peptidase [Bacteriovoracaceae bacterium]|nr:S8 family serine peptidase [Bacteriovoracaceae bacterium]
MRIFLLFTLVAMASCLKQEKESSSTPSQTPYSPAAPITYNADYYAKQSIAFTLTSDEIFGETLTGYAYTISNAPSWIAFSTTTGELTGTPASQGLHSNITVTATKALESDKTETFSIAVNGDPLRQHAWHLKNTGQKAFAYYSGTSGFDINVEPVYSKGITGKGVRVAVSDTGVEINHDDLYQNSLAGEHRNFSLSSPYYGTPTASHFHGTSVTSLISAKGWNNEGSMGVAPDSKFAGFQFLESSFSTSILVEQASGDFDVFNYSYGDEYYYDTRSDSTYLDHVRSRAKNGRGGLGTVYVKSAGNEFYLKDNSWCVSHNANAPFENESPYIIVVGAINADGKKASYSSAGSNLWVSAPGGEGGYSDPAIIAADLPTCFKGKSKAQSSPLNDFEYGHSENSLCNYTSTMNGTSSAAPILSGVVALMLEANPSLTQREIKHILAKTAKKIDSSSRTTHPSFHGVFAGCSNLSLSGHEYDLGWVENAAGYEFNNYYGFGLVDADAAVAEAQTPTGTWYPMPALIETNPYFNDSDFRSSPGVTIPDNSATGVSDTISVGVGGGRESDFRVESIQVDVSVTHAWSGEVGIEITSPSGKKSILLNINNSFLINGDSNLNMVLTSHAFYGEPAIGNWTIKAIDAGPEDVGTLNSWKLNILGHNP